MRKTLASIVLIVQNIVAFIVGLHCATSVQCLKRTRTLPDGRQETGAYARGGGARAPPLPHLEKKFRSEMSKRVKKVPPIYVGKKECARSAQIRQN